MTELAVLRDVKVERKVRPNNDDDWIERPFSTSTLVFAGISGADA